MAKKAATWSRMTRRDAAATVKALESAIAAGHPIEASAAIKAGKARAATIAARNLGLSDNAFTDRLILIERLHPDLKVRADAGRTLEQDVDLHRANTAASEARSSLGDARKEIVRLQDRIAMLESAARSSAKPADWTFRGVKIGGAHIPYLLTSDFQIGEVIRKEETDSAHGYDTATFRKRYRKLIEVTAELCTKHVGASWKFPGIIYARGGDTISGGIHEELAQTDDVTPIEACEIAFEEEAAGIRMLRDVLGKVDVKDAGGGNHDRSTMKPQSKRANALSYDRLVSFMLRREFAKDPRVTFQATESPDVLFPIYDLNVLLTHGDKIGSRGGMGFVGPVATIARGAQKVIMEQQALGRRVDRVDVGHFHTAHACDWFTANGCLPGYSEYAKMNRLRPAPPSQYLIFHHPDYGAVDHKLIVLEKPIKAAANAR